MDGKKEGDNGGGRRREWPRFTLEEVAQHNKEEDGWFIYKGGVYDATQHLKEIKEWKTSTWYAIMRILGSDCTEEMLEIGHSPQALAQIQAFKVGEVVVVKKEEEEEKETEKPS